MTPKGDTHEHENVFSHQTYDMMKICFVGTLSSTFIKNDYEILKKHFDVDVIEPPKKKTGWITYVFILAKKVKQSNLTFCWFAGWHSAFAIFFSKIFEKKSIVIAGGYDAAYVPEINYGAFTNLKERIPAKYVLKNADLILAVSEFTKNEILDRLEPKQLKVVHNGVDIEKFKPKKENLENIIVTVGGATKKGIKLKGLETFAKVSAHFSDYKFVIIGETEDFEINKLKRNNSILIFTGKITHNEVLKWLQRARIYCQLSYIESFGVGVIEAMSCGCTPIITERGALPEVVGNIGFYVPYGNEKATAEAVKKALNSNKGKEARERIKHMFPIEKRELELIEIINEVMTCKSQ